MKDLKAIIPALGYPPIIDLTGVYYFRPIDEEWQQRDNKSGEYKDHIYYSINADLVLYLIYKGYAELIERKVDTKTEYYIRLRHNY